ncbi:MAG: thioesterase [Bacteroidetes bacterium]|nr:MAG: thioesterase [Bacteroidota bacterium]
MNKTTIKIRGYHCDAYGHVNNARYLELLEEARWVFLEPAIREKFFESRNLLFVVVNINISYKKPLVPNQVIEIQLTNVSYNNKSIIVKQEIKDQKTQALCSSAEVTFVLLQSSTGKPQTITEEIMVKFDELSRIENA